MSENKRVYRNNAVLKNWVSGLPWKEQTGLISAIRGCDSMINKELNESTKKFVRYLRFLILKNADNRTTFMSPTPIPESEIVETLFKYNIRVYSVRNKIAKYFFNIGTDEHWLQHIILAVGIISVHHYDEKVKLYMRNILDKYNAKNMRYGTCRKKIRV